jgi:hypothetical protein
MQKQSRSRMDRGRGSADQRNQATISHELQKYSRSRTGKGMNSREVAGRLDPCRVDRDVAGGQRAGAEARRRRAGAEAPRRELTGGRWTPGSMSRGQRCCRRPASRGGGSSPASGGGGSSPGTHGRSLDAWIHVAGTETLPAASEQGRRLVAGSRRAGRGITARVRWRRREVRECGRRGLALGQRKGVRECLLGWAVSNGQIRIGRRTQYSRN